MIDFIVSILATKKFWMLVLCSFTMVLMTSWRFQLRDEIFWDASATIGRRKRTWGN